MENVIQLTRQLGAAIQATPFFADYLAAKIKNDEDDELQKMILEFNRIRMNLGAELSKGEEGRDQQKVDQLNSDMRATYENIMSNENMVQFSNTKESVDELMRQVNGILNMVLEGEDPMTCELPEISCGGDCSSCGGCH